MMKEQNFRWQELNLGVCYYPEHWQESLWEEDLKRMLQVGIKTIRIGEFAWSKFEPREGDFTYDFFDKFMKVVEKTGMKVIFGTPTATPPAWLTEKYPEVLNCDINGLPYRHGARRHYNYNSPKYIDLSARIVEKIVSHLGSHPNIIGWQIDNEFNCELDTFYSESDTRAFRAYLQKTYKTLDHLNEAWGTVFWNQTYTDWQEVYVPRKVIHDSTNPHMALDYSRFVSDSAIRYCKMQSDLIRKYVDRSVFITTNGLFDRLDNHQMTDDCLDVYTYDSYPNFAYGMVADPLNNQTLNDRRWSKHLSDVRSICPHFGIMEQQSGANGWNTRMEAPAPKPGQLMLWSMQSMAHGADYVSYFRWRTCTKGTEMYWHGILDYDNRDNRKLAEVAAVQQRVTKIQALVGADYQASVAVMRDYDNRWDEDVDVWHGQIAKASDDEIFVAAQLSHTPMDYIYYRQGLDLEDLKPYALIIYPHPMILSADQVDLLGSYVEAGGVVIFGARTGMKDERGQCVMAPMPGLAADLVGARVDDFTLIGPGDDPVYGSLQGKKVEMPLFNEVLDVDEATDILAVYTNNYYQGKPAITCKSKGKGKVIYIGASFSRDVVRELLAYTKTLTPYKSVMDLDDPCELAVRVKDGQTYYMVLNYGSKPARIVLKSKLMDMDTDTLVKDEVILTAYETKVYKA